MREKARKSLNLSSERILIVEDSPGIQKVLQGLLKRVGVQDIRIAADGQAALLAIKRWLPTIILSDWEMAPMDGKTFIKTLRSLPGKASSVPVIVITAHSENESINEIVRAGANQIQIKPIVPEQLYSRVSWVVEKRSEGVPELMEKTGSKRRKQPVASKPPSDPAPSAQVSEDADDAWLI